MTSTPDPNLTTTDVLEILQASGNPLREWGRALDGTPMLAARIGGDRKPAVFITAGAHCTETAGVHAALNLLDRLETDHEVHVLPLRDALGFAGVNRCLSVAAGHPVEVPDTRAARDFLTDHAQVVWQDGEGYLFKLGNLGFMWDPPAPGLDTWWRQFNRMAHLSAHEVETIAPLRGCSVMLVNGTSDVEGAGPMQRCYHTVLDAAGRWLHLNRYFGEPDAPPEVAAVDRLMQSVRPALTCDLHEGNGEGFWMPIPRPEKNAERVYEMTAAFFDHIRNRKYPVTTYENWLATDRTNAADSDWMLPEPRLPGLFWVNTLLRNEGHNLMTYGGLFGIGYGTEGPMERPLAMRVDGLTGGILNAIRVWEQTA